MISLSPKTQKKLTYMEEVCKYRGINLTAQRRLVLKLMLAQNKMISAYDLLDKLRQIEQQAKPPTVYRALEFLLQVGFIHKVESSNCYIVCPHFEHPRHLSILLICDACRSIIEEESMQVDNELTEKAKQHQFTIHHRQIEVHGICKKCQKNENK